MLAAGIGAGVWPDLSAALRQVKVEKTYTPDPDAHARYEQVFAAHHRLHQALGDVYDLVGSVEGATA